MWKALPLANDTDEILCTSRSIAMQQITSLALIAAGDYQTDTY